MNLRSTAVFFALLLSLLWGFGLMLTWKKTAVDESFVLASLQGPDTKVDTVVVTRKDAGKGDDAVKLVKEQDHWFLHQAGQKARVEDFKVDQLVSQIKQAKSSEEAPLRGDVGQFGLKPAEVTYTLKGTQKGKEKEWTFSVGRESPDKYLVYVASSDRPEKAFAVNRSGVDNLLFKDPSTLRSKRVFEFTEAAATLVDVKRGDGELELQRGDDNVWRFKKPALGFADFEAKDSAAAGQAGAEGGVKGLLGAISGLRVEADDDFLPLGPPLSRYGLEDADAKAVRVEVGTTNDKKEVTKETLLVGAPKGNKFYARLKSDEGVFLLSAKALGPIFQAAAQPGEIRSRDVAAFDPKTVDAVTLTHGKTAVKFAKVEGQGWTEQVGDDRPRKASDKALDGLIEALRGKKAIVAFLDAADEKKLDAEQGLDSPSAEVTVQIAADKDNKNKIERKDAAPAVRLAFGKADKATVPVKRTLPDGTVSRFTLSRAVLDRVSPPEGPALAYLDPSLPAVSPDEVTTITLRRGGETVELDRQGSGKDARWLLKDPAEPTGGRPADAAKVGALLKALSPLTAQKWVARLDEKDGRAKYGLEKPDVTVSLAARPAGVTQADVATAMALLAAADDRALVAAAGVLGRQAAGTKQTVAFGKAADGAVYAEQAGVDTVFQVPADVVKQLRDADLRDRTVVLHYHPTLIAGQVAALGAYEAAWLAVSPLMTGQVANLDPARVKEIKVALRTPAELRQFTFQRAKAGADWQDVTGLQEFQLDPARVTALIESLSRLQAERLLALTGGPRADQKLTAKEALLRIELTADDGKSQTLTVGAPLERAGYYAASSAWPDAVFLLPAATVDPLQRGAAYFAKDRVAAVR